MYLRPHAKINLGLFIKGKRPDGYHLLETVLYPLKNFSDELWLEPMPGVGACTLALGGIELDGAAADNLCVRAYHLLRARFPDLPSVHIRLTKHIPAGAGLGGGSSDAAATLRGLKALFSLNISDEELATLAGRLGADVPFFIYDKPLLATGTGIELHAIDMELPYRIELNTPPLHSSTVAAYKALDYRTCDPQRDLRKVLDLPVTSWPEYLHNDLETPVFHLYPQLAEIKQSLYDRGAVYAAMSGSGSAVFGLFESGDDQTGDDQRPDERLPQRGLPV